MPRAAARRAASPGGGRAVNHSRLNAVADAAHSAEYSYHADSDILHTTTLKQGANTRLTTTRAHDDGNCPLPLVDDLRDGFACNEPLIAAKQCLTSITSTLPNLTVASSHSYTHNALPRQRHRCIGLRRRRPHSAWPERSAGNNGNVTALISATDSTVAARYDYNAFGQTILIDGEDQAIAESNQFRFSTKYEDGETGLYDYGYRYLDPGTGRWLNRDPIEERGGVNLYGFVGNDGVGLWDCLGLARNALLTDTRLEQAKSRIDRITVASLPGLGFAEAVEKLQQVTASNPYQPIRSDACRQTRTHTQSHPRRRW